jgi:hypothetical protein
MNMTKSATIIMYGSLAALLALSLAIGLRPESLSINKGFGYFSAGPTQLLYLLAYGLLATTYWVAAKKGWIKLMLRTIAVLLVAMALTPARDGAAAHMAVASALVSFEMVVSMWIAIKSLHWIDGLLITAQFIAGLVILFSLGSSAAFLLHAQIVFQVCFTALLVRAFNAPTDKNILSI